MKEGGRTLFHLNPPSSAHHHLKQHAPVKALPKCCQNKPLMIERKKNDWFLRIGSKVNLDWVIVSYKIINCSEPFCLATAISPPTWPRADISAILLHHLFTFTTTTFKIQEAKINSVTHRRNYTITHLSKFVQLCVSVDPTKADLWEWLPSGSPEK